MGSAASFLRAPAVSVGSAAGFLRAPVVFVGSAAGLLRAPAVCAEHRPKRGSKTAKGEARLTFIDGGDSMLGEFCHFTLENKNIVMK